MTLRPVNNSAAGVASGRGPVAIVEGYDAIRIFFETIWRRHGKTNEESNFSLAP
jgi:hypothetical protein